MQYAQKDKGHLGNIPGLIHCEKKEEKGFFSLERTQNRSFPPPWLRRAGHRTRWPEVAHRYTGGGRDKGGGCRLWAVLSQKTLGAAHLGFEMLFLLWFGSHCFGPSGFRVKINFESVLKLSLGLMGF
ncbi:hypothetical protein ES319_A04G028000v1 [Gossypium barbadense]|uniref:Uncharacterized protein n=1 Tax=Gossypium barbadense TaxID=3634 RepID=A0A5J5W2N5_GOSBA|nr:hypothetical protein ES319_A04G028000v1 [Gossypium barbadense]